MLAAPITCRQPKRAWPTWRACWTRCSPTPAPPMPRPIWIGAPLSFCPCSPMCSLASFPLSKSAAGSRRCDFPDESLVVEADSEALARMFENLVSNALRYGTSAPSIIQRGRTLTFSNKVPDPAAIDVNRLFERFYRADVARAQGGAGLGLAVVASLATAQNIEVEASLEGDELFLTLDLSRHPLRGAVGEKGTSGFTRAAICRNESGAATSREVAAPCRSARPCVR